MSMAELPADFRDLLVCLADEGADFLLVDGYALAVHGYVRATDDLDVLVRPTRENARRVFRALVSFGAPVEAHAVTEGLFAEERYGYRMGVHPNVIEVLTTIDGVSFDEAWDGHRVTEIDGREIPVIGRRALLVNKRAAGRPQDLADAAWLEENGEED